MPKYDISPQKCWKFNVRMTEVKGRDLTFIYIYIYIKFPLTYLSYLMMNIMHTYVYNVF